MTINTEPQWYVDLLANNHTTKSSGIKSWEIQWIPPSTPQPPEETQVNELSSVNWMAHKDTEWLSKQIGDATTYTGSFTYPNLSADGNYRITSTVDSSIPTSLTIVGKDSKPLVIISNDGTIKLGDGANMEDAVSRSYWRLLEACGTHNKISFDVRNALGCSEGDSILQTIQALKRQVEELSAKVKDQPTTETDTASTAYDDRAMKVV